MSVSMPQSRAVNASRNVVFGVLMKAYQIVMPFIMRTCMIYFLGVEYLGLNGLFVSVLQFLNLAELGVGSAMVYSMYKPIAEKDNHTICALLALYRRFYRVIGIVVLLLGLALVPFLPYLVHDDIPSDLSLTTLYSLYLGGTVITYWLFAYKSSLLQAEQRSDVVSKVGIGVNTAMYAAQFLIIIFTGNYYGYVIAYVASLLATNIVSALCASRLYPHIRPAGRLTKEEEREIAQRIRDLFTAKLGGVLLNSAPTVIVSAFLGLTVLAIYQNYLFIVQSVTSLVGVVFTACLASIGNSIVTESAEKNYRDLRVFTLMMLWVIGFCTCCILCLSQPFMELWVGEGLMLEFTAVISFACYFLVFNATVLLTTFKDAAGIWHQDRFRPLATSVMSVILSLILINWFGVYGVIVSTPISQTLIALPWVLHNLFTYLFKRDMLLPYLKEFFYLLLVSAGACSLSWFACFVVFLDPLLSFVIRFLICLFVFNVVYIVFAIRLSEFVDMLLLVNRVTKGKFKFIEKGVKRLAK